MFKLLTGSLSALTLYENIHSTGTTKVGMLHFSTSSINDHMEILKAISNTDVTDFGKVLQTHDVNNKAFDSLCVF